MNREREMKSGSGQVQLKEGWEIPGGKREMDGHRGSLTECVGQGFPNSNISCGRETATFRPAQRIPELQANKVNAKRQHNNICKSLTFLFHTISSQVLAAFMVIHLHTYNGIFIRDSRRILT